MLRSSKCKTNRRETVLLLLTLVFVLSFSSHTLSDEWRTIRGNHWDGHSSELGLAESWPADGPPVLWTRDLGQGYSSFIAWDDSVATQYQSLGGQYVVCLSAETGETKWEYRYDWPYDPAGVYPGPRSTPTYDQGRVYFTSPNGLVACLDAKSGKLLWSLELEKEFAVHVPGFGYACSPIVFEGNVILPVGAKGASVVAIDKLNGKVSWRSQSQSQGNTDQESKPSHKKSQASYCPVLPISFQGRNCVLCFLENELICVDAKNGETIWSYHLSTGYDEHAAWPVYSEPFVWISGPFQRGSELLEISDANQSVRLVWNSRLMSNDIFSSVLHDGAIFGFDLHEAQAKTHRTSRGVFRCINFQSGKELWSVGKGRNQIARASDEGEAKDLEIEATPQELTIGHSTVLIADGKMILMNDLGELILAKADRGSYQELGRTPCLGGEICWTQPSLSRKRLFARNQSRAICVYLGSPDSLTADQLAKATSAAHLPQPKYRNLARTILGIEPEYLFDVPSMEWFTRWYVASIGIMCLAYSLSWIVGSTIFRKIDLNRKAILIDRLSIIAMFFLGAAGTTLMSTFLRQFIFTWQICIYVAFEVAIANASRRSEARGRKERLIGIGSLVLLLGTCLGYFLLCRRLSLVFEWVFLLGLLAATPFTWFAEHRFQKSRCRYLWRFFLNLAGYSAFYWSAVAFICTRGG